MKDLCLEYDDLHPKHPENCIKEIRKFISVVPDIKLSFFVPAEMAGRGLHLDEDWCRELRKYVESGNICLGVHGLLHTQEEFKYLNYDAAKAKLERALTLFDKAKLPVEKIFRGPHWGINQETYSALIDLDFDRVYSHQDYSELSDNNVDIETIVYNANLKDPLPDLPIIIAHGHSHNVCGNGIQETFNKVLEFIDSNDISFHNIRTISNPSCLPENR